MNIILQYIIILSVFVIISISANQFAKLFQKIHFPLITGLLIMGIICGPYLLNLISLNDVKNLDFLNDISLAFIAFSAGAELYLKELRSRFKIIKWMTFGQLFFTFTLSSLIVFFIGDFIPFMSGFSIPTKIAISLLIGTIFVARSPVSAIAVINELKAKGPFTQTSIGVTVLKDVLVIILFAICISIADALIIGGILKFNLIWIIIIELTFALLLGYALGKIISYFLSLKFKTIIKAIIILILGYSIYLLTDIIENYSHKIFSINIYIEPLLICIIGSFVVNNYSKYRREFLKIIHDVAPVIYIIFFTLAGVSVSLDVIAKSWIIAFVLFFIRLVTMMIGAYIGGTLGGDPLRFNKISWMPYVTQAGVALGLVTVVAGKYPEWGQEFATIIISVIVLNQIIGPPLFKWAINHVGESHTHAPTPEIEQHSAFIFGLESQSIMLAQQLQSQGWHIKIITKRKDFDIKKGLEIVYVPDFSLQTLKKLRAEKLNSIICMLSDEENYKICQLAYENFGTKELIVLLYHRFNIERFHKLGALIVYPDTAIISLLDHLVRSPVATSLLLGMEPDQDVIDIVVRNGDIHGLALRDIRLPANVLILATKRAGHKLISTGFTRLRLGDIITLVGSVKSLEEVKLRFGSA
ncbi:MAG: cation:proton antiporter [Bacteroidales bacterium]|nr:cation:proton antiporter [Bacteroidales bacterium]